MKTKQRGKVRTARGQKPSTKMVLTSTGPRRRRTNADGDVDVKPKTGEEKAARKKEIAEKVAKKVRQLTELSRSTIEQAAALVDAYDAAVEQRDALKAQIAEKKGLAASDKAELRKLARDKDIEDADRGKRFASIERDLMRREADLVGLQERRTAEVEVLKSSMAELRQIIKDKLAGALLFEQGEAPSAEKAAKPPEVNCIYEYSIGGRKARVVVKRVSGSDVSIRFLGEDGQPRGEEVTGPWKNAKWTPVKPTTGESANGSPSVTGNPAKSSPEAPSTLSSSDSPTAPKSSPAGGSSGSDPASKRSASASGMGTPNSGDAESPEANAPWRSLHVESLDISDAAKAALKRAGLKTLLDIHDFRGRRRGNQSGRLTSIDGISPTTESIIEAALRTHRGPTANSGI